MATPTAVCPSCRTRFPRPKPTRALQCPACGHRLAAPSDEAAGPSREPQPRRRPSRRGPLYAGISFLAVLVVGGIVLGAVFWARPPAAVAVNPDGTPPAAPAEDPPVVPGEVPPVTPAQLAADAVEVPLPGAVADTCVGGSGRYFILHLPAVRMLAVFDMSLAKVVKYLPTPGDDIRFAAGRDRLLVVAADTGVLTRYSLASFEREGTFRLPLADLSRVRMVAMGASSDGPLLVAWARRGAQPGWSDTTFGLYDGATYRALDTGRTAPSRFGGQLTGVRANANGTVFTANSNNNGSVESLAFAIRGDHFQSLGSLGGYVATPGPDGCIHTLAGRYDEDMKPPPGVADVRQQWASLPATSGVLYFTRHGMKDDPAKFQFDRTGPQRVEVRAPGELTPLCTLDDIPGPGEDRLVSWSNPGLLSDQRYLLVPEAEVFVAIPRGNDRLVVRRCLTRTAGDFLYVGSRPPAVVPGQPFRYQIDARSGKGGVRCRLDAGPPGATLSESGLFEWAVPADFKSAPSPIVSVTADSGKSLFHTFDLKPATDAPLPFAADSPPAVAVAPTPREEDAVRSPARVVDSPRTALAAAAAVALPGVADATCVGGGGRYFLLRLPSVKQLAVVDLSTGTLAKLLPLPDSSALFAAGMSAVVVYSPTADTFQRWSLETFEKVGEAKNPVGGSPVLLAHGHACDGPLLVCGPNVAAPRNHAFLDAATFADLNIAAGVSGAKARILNADKPRDVSASANGRVFGWYEQESIDGYTATVVLRGRAAVGQPAGQAGADDPDSGVFRDDRRLLRQTFPATDGPFRLQFGSAMWSGDRETTKGTLAVELFGQRQASIPLTDLPGFTFPKRDTYGRVPTGLQPVDRLVLNPAADVLALLNDTGNKVHVQPLNLAKRMAEVAPGAVAVLGRPPAAVRGSTWTFTPTVLPAGEATVTVESGPPGMKAVGGTATWAVPAAFAARSVPVILSVRVGGTTGFRVAELPVLDAGAVGPPRAAVPPPAVAPKVAVVDGFDIPKTTLIHTLDVPLDEQTDRVEVGGGGRFLVCRIPKAKELAVLDVCEAKVVKRLPLPAADAPFAVGSSILVVWNQEANAFERWSLRTFEKQATVKTTLTGTPKRLLLGHGSNGPLVVLGTTHPPELPCSIVDTAEFKPVPLTAPPDQWPGKGSPLTGIPKMNDKMSHNVGLSPDGRVLVWGVYDGPTPRTATAVLGEKSVAYHVLEGKYGGHPTASGDIVIQRAFYTPTLTPHDPALAAKFDPSAQIIPATSGPLYLDFRTDNGTGGAMAKKNSVMLGFGDRPFPPVVLPQLAGQRYRTAEYYLIPEAHLLAFVGVGGDKVHLDPINLGERLAKAGTDFALAASRPPAAAKGKEWEYRPVVLTRSGKPTVKVVSGPAGMTAAEGVVRWPVPAGYADPGVPVMLGISDDGKAEAFHSFTLPVGDPAPK